MAAWLTVIGDRIPGRLGALPGLCWLRRGRGCYSAARCRKSGGPLIRLHLDMSASAGDSWRPLTN